MPDLIPDSTIWSEVEILSLIVCSCIPCLRSIVKKFPKCNRLLGLSETNPMTQVQDEEQRHSAPPLQIRNSVRTGLTPPSTVSSPLSGVLSGAQSSRHMTPWRAQGGSSGPRSPRRSSRSSFPFAGWTPSPGAASYSSDRRASWADYFPRQLPRDSKEGINTPRAESLPRQGLAGQTSSLPSSLSPSGPASRRRSQTIVPEVEEEQDVEQSIAKTQGTPTNIDRLLADHVVGVQGTRAIERAIDRQDVSVHEGFSPRERLLDEQDRVSKGSPPERYDVPLKNDEGQELPRGS